MKTSNSDSDSRIWERVSARGMVLAVLGVITVGVAVLSVYVSYQILHPRFGGWSSPTVGALDALWVVFQATEILAGNNRRRGLRVQCAGLVLTAVNAAIPTADLILHGGFDLAVILTPVAIVATKSAWWLALPSLGRRTSPTTREIIDVKRQQVADRLEEMEAEAAHRIELLATATDLERRVARAETRYRKAQLKAQQKAVETLHKQAQSTQATITDQPLPALVAHIELPDLDTYVPAAPALPGTPAVALDAGHDTARHTTGTQVSALAAASGTVTGTDAVTPGGTPSRPAAHPVPLERLAQVAGVPVPEPGEALTDTQIGVVLRYLRYADNPPLSYRQARDAFRTAKFVGSEERIRTAWAALTATEGHGESADTSDDEACEDADA